MQERLLFVNIRSVVPGTEKIREAHHEEHRAFVADLGKTGKVVLHGRFEDGSGVLHVFDTSSLEEAKTILSKDPFSIYGVTKDDVKACHCNLIKVNLDS